MNGDSNALPPEPMPMRTRLLLSLPLLAIPALSWAFFKPIRVLAPRLAGQTCAGAVCVDDPSRLAQAQAIYRDALAFVDQSVGHIQSPPRVVFCSTLACSRRFGFTSNGAYTVGVSGIVISHRGWAPYFARHELIHHLQNERLGVFGAWLGRPTWWREGMAYSLSLDDRRPLPQPLEGYRSGFDQWLATNGRGQLWTAAAGANPAASSPKAAKARQPGS
ncbi:MAG: hypothetical protein ACJ8GJ_07765 [Vitreoscilla sp.]